MFLSAYIPSHGLLKTLHFSVLLMLNILCDVILYNVNKHVYI